MKQRDNKTIFAIYAIWELLLYYAELLNFEVPKCPSTLIGTDDGITILVSTVSKRHGESTKFTPDEVKDILNSYIPFLLFEKYPQLPPFFGGNYCGDITEALTEALYVYSVFDLKSSYQINTVLVENPDAYNLVLQNKKRKKGNEKNNK